MTETPNGSGAPRFDSSILRVVRWFLFATLLVPLVVFPGFFFPFVTIRAVYFRVLVELAMALILYLVLRREIVVAFRRDIVFWALLAWVAANALAAVFGVALMRSLFGDHERMGGVWFWVHLLAYYMALRTALRPDDWWRFLRLSIGVAAASAAYGLIGYWFPLGFGVGGVDTGSTVGNSGLFAGYLLANVAFCAILATRTSSAGRLAYAALASLLVAAMAFSGNRSSALALVLGSGAALAFHALLSGTFRGRPALIAGSLFALAAALPFVTRTPWARPLTVQVPVLNRLSWGADSSRVVQWRAAVDGIRERPLLGVGPENYQIIWSLYYHPEMYRFLSDTRWDRAHNAYLEAFATAGVLGFLSLLSIWIALAWSAATAARRLGRPVIEAIGLGFFGAYAFYLFFWFFDLNSTMLWIVLAAFVASRASGEPLIAIRAVREKRWQSTLVLGFGAAGLVSVLYVHAFATLRMARTLVVAGNPALPMRETLAAFESIFASPAPVTQHAFVMYAGRLRGLYPRYQAIRNDTSGAKLFDRAFILAIREFERQSVQDPLNERVLVQHARVLILGAYYYNAPQLYEVALAKLRQAVALAPRRVNTHLVLGVAYLNGRRPDLAREVFQRAYAVYPPFGQTHSYLAQAYTDLGKHDSAGMWLRSAVANGYDPGIVLVQNTSRQLVAEGDPLAGAELLWDYLRAGAGPAAFWAPAPARSGFGDAELADRAAALFSSAGDSARARIILASAHWLCLRPVPLSSLGRAALHRDRLDRAADCREPWRSADVL